MNWKTWLPLVIAIVFALAAAKEARDWMLRHPGATHQAGNWAQIVIASKDIQPGSAIRPEDLTTTKVEPDHAPAGSFTSVDQLEGRSSASLIVQNQALVESMLAPRGAGSGLQALVPVGMRAITIEVNEYSGLAGLLQPGCHVDIISTIGDGSATGQIARTIVQNVTVTAVGQRTSPRPAADGDASKSTGTPPEPTRSITVLATPSQAESIELACATGRPRLVLRSGRDSSVASVPGVSIGELRGKESPSQTSLASLPTVVATPPAIAIPATQPVERVEPATEPVNPVAIALPPSRTIRVFKGGVESTVTLTLGQAPDDTTTATLDPFERR